MYRDSDRRVFLLLSSVANVFAFSSLGLILAFHFYIPWIGYRNLAVIFLIFSLVFKSQLFMQKVEIIEKRVFSLLDPSMRPGKFAANISSVGLIVYLVLFWIAVGVISFSYMPVEWMRRISG